MEIQPLNSSSRSAGQPAVIGARPDGAATDDSSRILGRIGCLSARLAGTPAEIRAAQALRYQVFKQEFGTFKRPAGSLLQAEGLDRDHYDTICDHLLVIDESRTGPIGSRIVGTYRLLRQEVARDHGGFYSTSEFEIGSLVARHPHLRFLELGRSCVLPDYRTRRTVELLWQGIWAYVLSHGIDAMFGCASFPGTVPAAHALALSQLHHHHRAKDRWFASARAELYQPMNWMPAEAISIKSALSALPPLIKGYLRLGASFGDGAVIDTVFGTTDVLVILPVSAISDRYVAHYGSQAQRFA